MKTSIALIGFMGTGKTAVARLLAQKLGKQLVELDHLIEKSAGKSIADIFHDSGETAFRQLEIDVTREVAGNKNQVIACGGGIVLNRINIDRLKEEAVVVYLTASPDIIRQRVSSDGDARPLLATDNKAPAIRQMLEFRQPFYERAADIKIDTSALDIEATTEMIIDRLKEYEGFDWQK
jgi:shikimate kinase